MGDRRTDGFGNLQRRFERRTRQKDDKLFTAPAEHQVILSAAGFKRSGERDEHLITLQVTKEVIDVFKMIGIHQQQAKLLLGGEVAQVGLAYKLLN